MTKEDLIKELIAVNGWTREKAEEFCTGKCATLALEVKLDALPETLGIIRKHGTTGDRVTLVAVVPEKWLGALKADLSVNFGPGYLDELSGVPAKPVLH